MGATALQKSYRRAVKSAVKGCLAAAGLEVRLLRRHDWTDVASFIPFTQTLSEAEKAGLSVGDYIDSVMNHAPGATQATIDGMAALGVFSGRIDTVLEIGPGSGRYLEKVIRICSPKRCEIYETAEPWAQYVVEKYGAIRQPTDGSRLAATPAASVDLVQAHKVFSGIHFLPTLRYWREMVRVMRPGGFAVFDVVTEACLAPDVVERWIDSGLDTGSYPAAVPRQALLGYFERCGCACVGSFQIPMGPGTTETFVLRRGMDAGKSGEV
jgi:SAM-dependent methyltransferase